MPTKPIQIPFPSPFFLKAAQSNPVFDKSIREGYQENSIYTPNEINLFFSTIVSGYKKVQANPYTASAEDKDHSEAFIDLGRRKFWFGKFTQQDDGLFYDFQKWEEKITDVPFIDMVTNAKIANVNLNINIAKACMALAISVKESDNQLRYLQGGIIESGQLMMQRWLHSHKLEAPLPFRAIQIKKSHNNVFTITRTCQTASIDFSYQYTLEEKNHIFILKAHDTQAHFAVTKPLWNALLSQAEEKLTATKFDVEDCFSLIPFLCNKPFAQKFIARLNSQQLSIAQLNLIKNFTQACFPAGKPKNTLALPGSIIGFLAAASAIAVGVLFLMSVSCSIGIISLIVGAGLTVFSAIFACKNTRNEPPEGGTVVQLIKQLLTAPISGRAVVLPRPSHSFSHEDSQAIPLDDLGGRRAAAASITDASFRNSLSSQNIGSEESKRRKPPSLSGRNEDI